MKLAVVVGDQPADVIRLMPAWTDARRAVPGLTVTVLGSPVALALAARHDAVMRGIRVNMVDWAGSGWSWRQYQARRALDRELAQIDDDAFDFVVDPLGTFASSGLAARLPGLRCGLSGDALAHPKLEKRYQSRFPIPGNLHPVQRHRVMFAAILDYSIFDLKPDYGLIPHLPEQVDQPEQTVVVALDTAQIHWNQQQLALFKEVFAQAGVRKQAIAPEAPAAVSSHAPRDVVDAWWEAVANSAYVIATDCPTAHLAAALGRPGLMLCRPGQAPTTGAISCRHAHQAIINLDQPEMMQMEVVAAATLKALQRLDRLDPEQV